MEKIKVLLDEIKDLTNEEVDMVILLAFFLLDEQGQEAS